MDQLQKPMLFTMWSGDRHGDFINVTQLLSCPGFILDVQVLKEAIKVYFGGE